MASLRPNGSLQHLPSPSYEAEQFGYSKLHFLATFDEPYGGYTTPDTRIINLLDFNNQRATWRYDVPVAVYGKVIYERIKSWNVTTRSDTKYDGGVYKGAKVEFNWKIESQMPPTALFSPSYASQPTFWTGIVGDGWAGYYNAPIENVYIRVRKLKGARTSPNSDEKGGINSSNPFGTSEYDEVAYIRLAGIWLRTPSTSTLNDTNLGRDTAAGRYVTNKSKLNELRGYADETITIDTATNTVTFTSASGTTYGGPDSEEELLFWNSGFSQFEPDTYYYLTIEPESHPMKRIEVAATNANPMLTPCDGYYGIEKLFPYAYVLGGGDPTNGITEPFSLYPWKINKRFTPGEPEAGGWTRTGSPVKKPATILSKLNNPSIFYSDNDIKIDADEFHMYGYNIRNHAEDKLTAGTILETKFTRRDKIDVKAEYFAWFKTPYNKRTEPPKFDINLVSKGSPKSPSVYKDTDPLLTDVDATTKRARIYGKFWFETFDFYIDSEFTSQVAAANNAGYPLVGQQIQEEINKVINKPKIPGDKPKKCGFRYRNRKGDNVWNDIVVRSDLDTLSYNEFTRDWPDDLIPSLGPQDTSKIFYFDAELPKNILSTDQYEYQVWIEKTNPAIRFYAEPAQTVGDASIYQIQFGSPTFTDFVGPNKNNKGFWYQMYSCWKLVVKDDLKLQVPYLTRRTDIASTTKAQEKIPVHYFMNMTFTNNTNYQFRTTLENHLHGQNFQGSAAETNDSTESEFHIMLPWSENLKIQTPYINAVYDELPGTTKILLNNINVYMYSNINAYSLSNAKKIVPSIPSTSLANKPRELVMSKHNPQNPITYTANMKFTQSLSYVGIAKSDWFIQGFAPFNILNQNTSGMPNVGKGSEIVPYFINGEPMGGKGWHWLEKESTFVWFDKLAPQNNLTNVDANKNLPIGGNVYDYFSDKSAHIKYLLNNFIARFIIYQKFNFSFDYENKTPFAMSMYVGRKLPYLKDNYTTNIDELVENGDLEFIGKFGPSTGSTVQKCQFYGIEGNRYLIFVADPVVMFSSKNLATGETTPELKNFTDSGNKFENNWTGGWALSNGKYGVGTYSVIRLSNFVFSSNYHEKNNEVTDILTTDGSYSPTPPVLNASYSITLGQGNNVFQDAVNITDTFNGKAGNATFRSGIWENGVWNNGWREDQTIYEFFDVKEFFSYNKDRVWRIKVYGPVTSVANFSVGDRVSFGNLTAIDINNKRKFLKKYYYIIDIQDDYIEFEYITEFPIKRIERDSKEHRVMVSKNVWMNGIFFNGYFKGIWNNGIFSGYPKLAKMDESQWIDGTFNGGHFTANKYAFDFSSVTIKSYENTPRLTLTTQKNHRLTKDDIISITYSFAGQTKYLGTTLVLDTPSDKEIVTGILWDETFAVEITNGGRVLTVISTGLIQNFNFYSRNVSKVTSIESMVSESVFSYDSWIDVNYSNQSAVNIGRPQSNTEQFSKRLHAENNHYGYPTADVLSSNSVFRDSFSLSSRKYRLGSKFEVYNDFVGPPSAFEDYFEPTITTKGLEQFAEQGWSFKVLNNNRVELFALEQSVAPNLDLAGNPNTIRLKFGPNPNIQKLSVGKEIEIIGPGYKTIAGKTSDVIYTDSKTVTGIDISTDPGFTWIVTSDTRPLAEWNINGVFRIGFTASSGITFSRTQEPITADTAIQGKELKINATGKGGILDLIPNFNVSGRKNGTDLVTVDQSKYTMVEFDLIDFSSATNSTTIERENGVTHPPLHFNNLNYVTRGITNNLGITEDFQIGASYLPVYKNVNHLTTFGNKKQEFFFNKRNLMMNIHGLGPFGAFEMELYVDNLKLYEVDMIPFFQYFRDPGLGVGNINVSIQAPRKGKSPIVITSDDEISDTETPNEIIGFFTDKLISENIDAPLSINWEQDYAIYRPQIQDLDDPNSLYGEA
jgi:hypothetical protein